MALNPSERAQYAQALLRCFGEDYNWCGRNLRFITDVAGVNLLTDVQNAVDTWQPFITAGMDANSRAWWKGELARVYNGTVTS